MTSEAYASVILNNFIYQRCNGEDKINYICVCGVAVYRLTNAREK